RVPWASVRPLPQWTMVHERADRVRLVGDIHVHTGQGSRPFVPSAQLGDHAGGYSRLDDALRYLSEVVGADFANSAEHGIRDAWVELPPGVVDDPAFGPGGACAPLVEP